MNNHSREKKDKKLKMFGQSSKDKQSMKILKMFEQCSWKNNQLQILIPNFDPEIAMADYELASKNAFREFHPNCCIHGLGSIIAKLVFKKF